MRGHVLPYVYNMLHFCFLTYDFQIKEKLIEEPSKSNSSTKGDVNLTLYKHLIRAIWLVRRPIICEGETQHREQLI